MKNKLQKTTCSSEITRKFESHYFFENRLRLQLNNNTEQLILFSEVQKIYIQKYKLGWLQKVALITLFIGALCIVSVFFSTELVMLSSALLIPIIVKLNLYKWYELHLKLKEGQLYTKEFYSNTKHEHIQFVNKVRSQIFECQINSNLSFTKVCFEDEVVVDCTNFGMSVA